MTFDIHANCVAIMMGQLHNIHYAEDCKSGDKHMHNLQMRIGAERCCWAIITLQGATICQALSSQN